MLNMLRTFFPLLLSTGAALFLTHAASDFVSYLGPGKELAPWSPFFSIFGMVYAIISGFLLVNVLGRYSNLTNTFEAELNAVEDIRDFLVYVDGEQEESKQEIREALLTYIRSVAGKEWKAMSRFVALDSDTSEELYAVMRAVNKLRLTNESDRVALRSLMEKLSELTTLRTQRISLAKQKLPPRLKLLTFFMSLGLIAAMILVGAGNVLIHMGMVGFITIAVHLLYMIISDLDQPFSGVWNIDKSPLEKIQKSFLISL